MTSYSGMSRALHWLIALLILAMIPVGVVMTQKGLLPRPMQNTFFIFHKNFGVIVLLLMALRLAWRALRPAPDLPASVTGWQRKAAAFSHVALYVLAFVVPLSGYVRVKAGGFPIEWLDRMGVPALVPKSDALASTAQAIHFFSALLLAALVLMHIGAALQHGLIKRDGVFSRMWPPLGRAAAERDVGLKS
ncbi:MAG: cytochrome b [Pseudomonadota bacterium]